MEKQSEERQVADRWIWAVQVDKRKGRGRQAGVCVGQSGGCEGQADGVYKIAM